MSHLQNVLSPINTKEKTKRMGINTTNGQKQQLSTKSSTETKLTNTTQNRPCSNGIKRWEEKTWTTFTYYSPQIRKSPTYSNTNTGIAFRNTNTLQFTKPKTQYQTTEHNKSGAYKQRNTCYRSYIKQAVAQNWDFKNTHHTLNTMNLSQPTL